MYYAIIDAQSSTSRVATVAYGVKLCDIAEWFIDEFRENYEMYHAGEDEDDDEKVYTQCNELRDLADEDVLEISDIEGLSFAIADLSVEIYGTYETYEDFTAAFLKFVSDKPKYVKIKPQNNPEDIIAEIDRLNSLLIRESI